MELIFVAGLSGSGKTTVMQVFSEQRFTVIEGVSANVVIPVIENLENDDCQKVGVFIAEDNEEKFNDYVKLINSLRDRYNVKLMHITANHDVIISRYKELRKLHPLQYLNSGLGLSKSIEMEENIQAEFIQMADYELDTSNTSVVDSRNIVKNILKVQETKLVVNILSFGFKYGMIRDADYIIDVRFLPNPYYIKELRAKSGLDDDVYNYVFQTQEANDFYDNLLSMIKQAIIGFDKMSKLDVTIAFACTGGQHRSVSFARRLAADLKVDYDIREKHLEKSRGNW